MTLEKRLKFKLLKQDMLISGNKARKNLFLIWYKKKVKIHLN